jgi:thiamine biosynthesis protein ThiI
VSNYRLESETEIINALKTVFGINSLSTGYKTDWNTDNIIKTALKLAPARGTFRVTVNRADKTFKPPSPQFAAELGERLLTAAPKMSVNLHEPDFKLNVDIRENNSAYVFTEKTDGAGGMPVGSAGRGLLLLSGGIDSPVAGYMMSKRGMRLDALHFHSYPYTGEQAKQKVIALKKIMENYCTHINLICAPVTRIQEEINKRCDNSYLITILRRFMMRIAERVCLARHCDCVINGESLGQVASQTVQSITVTNACVTKIPVFRPLIGTDKREIIAIAEKIGTYTTSILPFEDCCTVFLPESPATKPTIERCLKEEAKLGDIEELINYALNNLEVVEV